MASREGGSGPLIKSEEEEETAASTASVFAAAAFSSGVSIGQMGNQAEVGG